MIRKFLARRKMRQAARESAAKKGFDEYIRRRLKPIPLAQVLQLANDAPAAAMFDVGISPAFSMIPPGQSHSPASRERPPSPEDEYREDLAARYPGMTVDAVALPKPRD